ncbi:MAG: CvpA family protein, partial [Polynucleobacter victoriensis]
GLKPACCMIFAKKRPIKAHTIMVKINKITKPNATWLAHEWLTGVPGGEMTQLALGFVILFILTMIVCALIGRFLAKIMQQAGLSPMDRLLGFAFGLLRGLLIVVILSSLIVLTSLSQTTEWRKAWSLPAVELLTGMAQAWLPDEWAAQVSEQLKK